MELCQNSHAHGSPDCELRSGKSRNATVEWNEGAGMVADAGRHASLSLRLVRFVRLAVFSTTTMIEVHGRTFGIWTLLTCTLCYLCAFNLENKPIYLATYLSFIYAFSHFLTEFMIYHTMTISNLTTVGIFAGTSIVWMLLQWNRSSTKRD